MNGLMTVTRSAKERLSRLYIAWGTTRCLAIDSASLQSLVINREIFIPDQEIFIILSKIGRSPAKSGDLEALCSPGTSVQLQIVGLILSLSRLSMLFSHVVLGLPRGIEPFTL